MLLTIFCRRYALSPPLSLFDADYTATSSQPLAPLRLRFSPFSIFAVFFTLL